MKKIEKKVLENAMTYKQYRQMTNDLFAQGKTTGDNHSEAMLNYTKMNIVRMNRLDKRTRLTEATLGSIAKVDEPLIWLVITEAWCGDAAQILPVLHQISEENEHIQLRLILRDDHLDIMDAFLTNGARSIPKMIILDAETLEVINTWGPRPVEVQQMVMDAKAEAISTIDKEQSKAIWDEAKKNSQLWYARDKTKTIQKEVAGTFKSII